MLVLARREGESIVIGEDVVVTVLGCEGGIVRLGISAPPSVAVLRQEIVQQVGQENRSACLSGRNVGGLAALRKGYRAKAVAAPGRNEQR